MIGRMIKAFLLMTLCIVYVSCSGDTKNLIQGSMMDSLTDTALNTAKSKASESDETSATSGKKSKSGKKYSGSATGDDHYIDNDVVFVSSEPFKGSGWIYVKAAKVVTAPSSKTKNEGQYMIISNGEEIWTKNFWKTRIATEKELKVGLIVIVFERDENGVYKSPEDKSQAMSGNWFMAKITDMSDKYQGYVTVSGGYKISLENLRVAKK
jgi:hypothetical protein